MFAINKNGTKHKVGIIMPAFFPASRVTHESVSVTADGVKTWATLLNELYALADFTKVNNYSYIEQGAIYFKYQRVFNNKYVFTCTFGSEYWMLTQYYSLDASSSTFVEYNKTTMTDASSNVAPSGTVIKLVY